MNTNSTPHLQHGIGAIRGAEFAFQRAGAASHCQFKGDQGSPPKNSLHKNLLASVNKYRYINQ